MTATQQPEFEHVREGDLTLADHEAVAAMLAQAFESYDHWYLGARSWAGAQPERRVLARDASGRVVAHAGLRRLFVRVGGDEVLLTSVGMVAVSPREQGTGLGGRLLTEVDAALAALGTGFGLLETGEAVQGFYRHAGWLPLEGLTGHFTAFSADGAGVLVSQGEGWLLREVRATADAWPAGDLHVDGQIV